jgi:predicted dehydrogenase/threonine dehydrogenase-like Zn-dependent dehydrogenase
MKQIIQNLSNRSTNVAEVPCPKNKAGNLLIQSKNSLVSPGTERMLVDFGKANILNKALQQPDKVKLVLDKIKSDGLLPTYASIKTKLDQPIALGYCNAGIVLNSKADGFSNGDRVVSNGQHAQIVRVPKNLCAKIPDEVDDESASFTVLASIGLQGVRLLKPTIGEAIVVFGLGLIGLITIQILKANGCRVLGIDHNSSRCKIANSFGIKTVDLSKDENPIDISHSFSRGRGVDGVIIAVSTQNDDVMHQAAEISRKRGRIILVGVTGLNLRRDDFYKKEISFQVSASYGPGRYDTSYEEKGIDYPIGFVRWTEQRNFEAVLDMMVDGSLDVKPLITHRFLIENAEDAYELLGDSSALGILLEYPPQDKQSLLSSSIKLNTFNNNSKYNPFDPIVGFIGAGNYASGTLIPAFKSANVQLDTLVTSGGVSAFHHGNELGFKLASTELNELWGNKNINTVVIATRHNLHADQVISAINSKKNVFVEKPLALTLKDLNLIDLAFRKINNNKKDALRLMIGFNRRFAPHIIKMKSLLEAKSDPKIIVMTINAGSIISDHWTQDIEIGGGRIVGEACHFIDLMQFLVGHPIKSHHEIKMGSSTTEVNDDKTTISLVFPDGSFGTIHYFANGGKIFPKERIEVFCGEGVLQIDNFKILKGYGWPNFKKMKLFSQDKGQKACALAFADSIRYGKPSPIPYDEIIANSKVSIEVAENLRAEN